MDAGLFVVDNQILDIGSANELIRRYPEAEITHFGHAALLPPFVNAHTHLELSLFPEWLQNSPPATQPETFVDWIKEVIRIKLQKNQGNFESSIRKGLKLSMQAGTGAVGDILSRYNATHVYREFPVLSVVFFEAIGRDPAKISELNHLFAQIVRCTGTSIKGAVSPHSPYTLSKEYLTAVLERAKNSSVLSSIHFAESPEEIPFIEKAAGAFIEDLYPRIGWQNMLPQPMNCTPADYIEISGGLHPDNILVHAVQLTERDIDRIAYNRSPVVLCPRSNQHLNVGIAPAKKLYRAGVKLALGTDSLASNDSLSIWDEIRAAYRLYDGSLSSETLLRMATVNGVEILQLGQQSGTLEKGRVANFQVVSIPSPDRDSIENSLCTQSSDLHVNALYLNGIDCLS